MLIRGGRFSRCDGRVVDHRDFVELRQWRSLNARVPMSKFRPVSPSWNRYGQFSARLTERDSGYPVVLGDPQKRFFPDLPIQRFSIVWLQHRILPSEINCRSARSATVLRRARLSATVAVGASG